mgnify:CR=1 FL=1
MVRFMTGAKRIACMAVLLLITALTISSYQTAQSHPLWTYNGVNGQGFPSIEMRAAPNALFAYFYGTPIYQVDQNILHKARFLLANTSVLNLWTFYYPPDTQAYVLGKDSSGEFIWVIVRDTGQVGWIPIVQTDLQPWMLDGLQVLEMENYPPYNFLSPGQED